MKTYIDEAGNTGSDLKQTQQPFFVLSAITLKEEKEEDVFKELESQFIQNKEKEEVEIKAVKWSKAPKKAKALQSIIENVLYSEGHISVIVIEKRYMISAMIVDIFFDPVYNDIKDNKWLNDTDEKIKAVNYFYSHLTDAIVYKLWDSIQNLNKDELKAIIEEIIKTINNEEYIRLLTGAINHISELANDMNLSDHASENGFNKSAIRSPNYTAFPTIMNFVVHHCRITGEDTRIIFDDAIEFNKSYQYLYDLFTKSPRDIPLPNGMLYSWKNDVKDFCVSKSEDEKGLQIADIVSSSVNQLMMKTLKDKPIALYDLFNVALLQSLDKVYESAWYVVSTQFWRKYEDMKIREAPKLSSK